MKLEKGKKEPDFENSWKKSTKIMQIKNHLPAILTINLVSTLIFFACGTLNIKGDQKHYLSGAYNLIGEGTYSISFCTPGIYDPDATNFDAAKEKKRVAFRDSIFTKISSYCKSYQIEVDTHLLFSNYDQFTKTILIDDQEFANLAKINIKRIKKIGLDTVFFPLKEHEVIRPTAYREPIPSCVYSIALFFNHKIWQMDRPEFMNALHASSQEINQVMASSRWILVVCIVMASIFLYLTIFEITRNQIFSFAVSISPFLFEEFRAEMSTFGSEMATYPFFILSVFFLIKILKPGGGAGYWISGGFFLGVLSLGKASFFYSTFPVFLLLMLYAWKKSINRKYLVFFVLGFMVPTGLWLARNYVHFGKYVFTQRAGSVLSIRHELNQLDKTDYCKAFRYWSKNSSISELKSSNQDKQTPLYEFLDDENPNGFYLKGKLKRLKWHLSGFSIEEAEERLTEHMRKKAFSDPIRHFSVMLPLSLRGVSWSGIGWVNIILYLGFLSLIIQFLIALVKLDWVILFLGILPLVNLGFMLLLTQNYPRFNLFAIPFLLAIGCFRYFLTAKKSGES